ncbi:uncharacterized protein LOC127854040 isoform X4 [Dreissena polymorpha]|nr:uncharacterized protein LOC127854040 isoform X3 [Dreissena polymorpha]XP_052244930.1 uncharacterized protein LOC127854040 isoform X4 [Dreissena polymorpha]
MNNHNQITDGSHGNNDEKGNTYCAPVFEVYDLPLTEPSEDPINNQQEYRNELNELRESDNEPGSTQFDYEDIDEHKSGTNLLKTNEDNVKTASDDYSNERHYQYAIYVNNSKPNGRIVMFVVITSAMLTQALESTCPAILTYDKLYSESVNLVIHFPFIR